MKCSVCGEEAVMLLEVVWCGSRRFFARCNKHYIKDVKFRCTFCKAVFVDKKEGFLHFKKEKHEWGGLEHIDDAGFGNDFAS